MKRAFLAFLALAGCGPSAPELHVLTWPNYFAKDTIAAFEKEAGCRVVVDYMESSETLRTKLAGGRSGYDVVFPSDEVVPMLVAQGALDKLELSKIPNIQNIQPRFRGLPYDPSNAWSAPYMWGTTGIAYLKEKVIPAPESWEALWDTRFVKQMTMLDDGREVFAAAMRLTGTDLRAAPPPEAIEKAKNKLLERKPKAYDSSPKAMLVNGDCWIAQCYSGDALQAAEELGGKVGYAVPKEGGTLWIDNLCIAKDAPRRELAHRFIDYLLRPEVSAAITNETRFPNPNEGARKHIRKEVLEDPRVFPPEEVLRRCSTLPVLSPEVKKALDAAWAEVKAR
jgi:spermidine/putrescine transport system substrate-binding protein